MEPGACLRGHPYPASLSPGSLRRGRKVCLVCKRMFRGEQRDRLPTWERIQEKIEPEPNSGCWLWTAALDSNGYGMVSYEGGNQKAHRVVWALLVGQLPPPATGPGAVGEMDLHHVCRVRSCVNPAHLRLISHRENVLLDETLAGNFARRVACAKCGGPLVPYATPRRPRDARRCEPCRLAYFRNYNATRPGRKH